MVVQVRLLRLLGSGLALKVFSHFPKERDFSPFFPQDAQDDTAQEQKRFS